MLLPSSSFLHLLFLFYSIFFSVNSIKWTEIVLLNTRTFSGHQRLAQKVPTIWFKTMQMLKQNNMLWTHNDIVSCCAMPTCPFCTLRVDPIPSCSLRLHEPCPPISCTIQPISLCFTRAFPASTPGEPDETWDLPSQTWNTLASTCSFLSVLLPKPPCGSAGLRGEQDSKSDQLKGLQ